MQIHNFTQAHAALRQYYASSAEYRLDTMKEFMAYIGNPQDELRVIHIAGTSGKTSTSYYIAGLLEAAGYKTGLTTSPHVDELNERVQIGLIPLPEPIFCEELGSFLRVVETSGLKLSYFEVMVAFAYSYFAKQKVDFAVIETGLGGRIDGTNVVTRHDKICVITNIGLDHTKILGTTIPAIAREKAGIILEGNEVFTHQQTEEALIVFEEVCASKHAELIIVPEQFMSETRDLPMFQQHNMGLAVACVRSVLDRGDRQLESAHIVKAAKTYVPARMERVIYRGKQLIIDGSHNGQKIQTLMESLTDAYPNASIAALVAFVAGDESRTKSGVKELVANASFIVVTEFTANQDVPKEAVPAPQVAAWCKEFGLDNVVVETEALRALDMLLERSEDILIVTGSFYLLNHIRPHIMKS